MSTPRLTPRMAKLLANIGRVGRAPLHSMTPTEARAAYAATAEVLEPPRRPLARVENITLPGGDGAVRPARLYAASCERLPVLLYLHGGGFVVGGLDTHDALCRELAHRSGGAVVALDYRLAPEHPFPAANDDAWAALTGLVEQGPALGLDAARLAIGGDSAGATLAAAAALMARDAGLPLALQLLITPGTAAVADSASHQRFADGFLIDAATIAWFFDHAIPQQQRRDWRFAPLEVPDVDGVAPACVLLAECDPLVDEGLGYADRLRAAGVPVALELYRGVTHDFIKMGRVLPEAALALEAAAMALQGAWSL